MCFLLFWKTWAFVLFYFFGNVHLIEVHPRGEKNKSFEDNLFLKNKVFFVFILCWLSINS